MLFGDNGEGRGVGVGEIIVEILSEAVGLGEFELKKVASGAGVKFPLPPRKK